MSFYLFLSILFLVCHVSYASTALNNIFSDGMAFSPCTRLLNSNGLIGCQNMRAKSGVLYRITTAAELNNFLSVSSSQNFVPALSFSMFTPNNIQKLQNAQVSVSGFVVLNFTDVQVASFSPAVACPNCAGLTDTSYNWNSFGSGLSMMSFTQPMYTFSPQNAVANTSFWQVLQAIEYNNAQNYATYPLYGLQFDSLMYGAGDAVQCLNPTFDTNGNPRCDPIGQQSVYASFSFNRTTNSAKPFLAVATALDAVAFFHNLAIGAETTVSGTVSQLAIIEALSRLGTSPSSFARDILFSFFQSESWNYAGSAKFAQDLSGFQCTTLSNGQSSSGCAFTSGCQSPCRSNSNFTRFASSSIAGVVALDQILGTGLDLSSNIADVYVHKMPLASSSSALAQYFLDAAGHVPASVSTTTVNIGLSTASAIPPNSGLALVNTNPTNIAGVVIGDYDTAFTNPYYASDLDDGDSWDQRNVDLLCAVSQISLEAIYNWANNNPSNQGAPPTSINCSLVSELMTCFTRNNSCSMFQNFLTSDYNLALASAIPINSHYSSVYSSYPNIFSEFTMNFATYYTSPARFAPSTVYNTSSNAMLSSAACTTDSDCAGLVVFQQSPDASASATALGLTCINATCSAALAAYHAAYSQGLSLDENSGLFSVTNSSAFIWTESRWGNDISATVFLVESYQLQVMQLMVGLSLTILTTCVVVFVVGKLKKSQKID